MNKLILKKLLNILCHLIGYTLVLIIASILFPKTIYIDSFYCYIWGFIAVCIIYILNKTVKPLLFWITIPLTALSLGLFYPIINILILKLTDFILLSHFEINGIISLFLVSIFISILNSIMDHLFVDKLLKGVNK